ncbi:MAG: peptide chain release factor 3 [Phycisphaerales bacterium]|nr:peptide chain release factor 3 [Phycisphaerales bacterium]
MDATFAREVARRRTFAIISHPDAGKTTLTEKFLLYGGAVQLAGSVTARKSNRAVTSDWMELERQRGISVTSTVLQFDYNGYCINLLDTPGHKDFSEDTYRVLTAVDAVVMVIDAGKGIESQTQKLFEICRRRGIPIFTFMNKLDRPTLDPLSLLDQLESVLGIHATAINWPLGNGPDFRGVFDRQQRQVHLFERTPHGSFRAPVEVLDLSDPLLKDRLSPASHERAVEEIGVLDAAGAAFDLATIRGGGLTPVFFGSAANNFGVQLLLDAFLSYATPPQPRRSGVGSRPVVPLDHLAFSGFIFKIQANMDTRHRDRVAFLRVCSGRFVRDMRVLHVQTSKEVRLASSHKLFGRDRETLDEAYPGDVIGLVGHAEFGIGHTLTEDSTIVYDEIPQFMPEYFCYLHSTNSSQFKQFRAGLSQLLQEGVIQTLSLVEDDRRGPLLAAVGPLQFEVVQYRLKAEYGADSRLEPAGFSAMRWILPTVTPEQVNRALAYSRTRAATTPRGDMTLLFPDEWALRYFAKEHPEIALLEMPPPAEFSPVA